MSCLPGQRYQVSLQADNTGDFMVTRTVLSSRLSGRQYWKCHVYQDDVIILACKQTKLKISWLPRQCYQASLQVDNNGNAKEFPEPTSPGLARRGAETPCPCYDNISLLQPNPVGESCKILAVSFCQWPALYLSKLIKMICGLWTLQ
ncbi:hypothetical protein PoB_003355300 [Plakobranchus ocellatus]|uniref:Fibronectin type-III domain-containing protein n=1 Tax=Plakobranchus ocellatus TaxID=259542 RepID=A0AAV4AKI9_9GAST|nr:hypothetical protein PoB_003355300 [Plakobranchus ocellatus]